MVIWTCFFKPLVLAVSCWMSWRSWRDGGVVHAAVFGGLEDISLFFYVAALGSRCRFSVAGGVQDTHGFIGRWLQSFFRIHRNSWFDCGVLFMRQSFGSGLRCWFA